ncbi:MAG TPA: 2-oxo acid dehydrogenase subunit E2 [Steroidobacteraceae bacterium]|nr:2-oxo acid dehydrogenase subunit E2 [Steroidobacteraceae bacterium]
MAATRLIDVRAPEADAEGTRSQVLRWLKRSGDCVARHEPLLEIETDKVTVEIASPADGVLHEVLKQAEEEISPGDLLARIEAREGLGVAAPLADTTVLDHTAQAEGAQADQPPHASRDARSAHAAHSGAAARLEGTSRSGAAVRVSPAVKRLLTQHGLDATAVRGTGRGGQITVDDVLRVAARSPEAAMQRAGSPGDELQGQQPRGAAEAQPRNAGRLVPHSPVRKRIAEHMVRSLHSAPHVTTVFEADFSAVLAHRACSKEEFAARGAPLTLTVYVLAACVDAIRAVPESNARWTDEALEIFDRIDIGVGTALPTHGLIVPVIRNVETLSLFEIARELGRLVRLARDDRLAPQDVRGGTFTISNHGVSGSLIAAPIVINQPQTAILGVGRIEKRPVVVEEDGNDRIVARPRAYLSLTIDHRVMDGHRANRFLETLVERIETWPCRDSISSP